MPSAGKTQALDVVRGERVPRKHLHMHSRAPEAGYDTIHVDVDADVDPVGRSVLPYQSLSTLYSLLSRSRSLVAGPESPTCALVCPAAGASTR